MKLMHYLFSTPIDFENCSLQQLVFENPDDMWRMVAEFNRQLSGDDGRYALFEGNKSLDISKNVVFIDSPFNLERFNKIIVQDVIIKAAKLLNDEDHQIASFRILSELEELIISVLSEMDLSLDVEGFSPQKVMKSVGLEIGYEGDVCNDMAQLCSLLSKYVKPDLIVIVNISNYVGSSQQEVLFRNLSYVNSPILLIDRSYSNEYGCKLFDADFCEIDVNYGGGYLFEV